MHCSGQALSPLLEIARSSSADVGARAKALYAAACVDMHMHKHMHKHMHMHMHMHMHTCTHVAVWCVGALWGPHCSGVWALPYKSHASCLQTLDGQSPLRFRVGIRYLSVILSTQLSHNFCATSQSLRSELHVPPNDRKLQTSHRGTL